MGALDVDAFANELLDVAAAALDTLPAVPLPSGEQPLDGAPGKQFTCTGTPVIDCEQLAVWVSIGDIEQGIQRETNAGVNSINWVTATIMVARCIPSPPKGKAAPTAAALSRNARQTNADMWVIWNAVKQARRLGTLSALCSTLYLGNTIPLNPGGSYGGWQLPVTAQIEGYKPLPVGSA